MNGCVRITFIHHANDKFYGGQHFDNTSYNFLVRALSEHPDVEYKKLPISREFDATGLKGKTDAVVLSAVRDYNIPKITGLKSLDVPVLARTGDFHDSKRYGTGAKNYDDWGVDCLFNFMSSRYFYDWYPAHMNYKTIFFGVEPSLYKAPRPYDQRIKDQILVSGAADAVDPLANRMPYLKWLPRRTRYSIKGQLVWILRLTEPNVPMHRKIRYPHHTQYHFYKLRTDCKLLPYVADSTNLARDLTYEQLLYGYCGAIAATTFFPTIKYWEIAAAGCLTFMELTERNYGDYLGFRDGVNCVAINEHNCRERFEKFLDNPNSYAGMADMGRKYALETFSNDVAADRLVSLIREFT